MIRVIIAEDSITNRELIAEMLRSDPAIEIVGGARNGIEALELIRHVHPDLVLMDISMPRMDGFEATKAVMIEQPTPIVIMSGGANGREVELSMHALRAGALAVCRKPPMPGSDGFEEAKEELVATTKAMSQVKLVRRWNDRQMHGCRLPHGAPGGVRHGIVAIAASTGGPAALQRLLSDLPTDFAAPIVVVQHITSGFVGGLVSWLNTAGSLRVKVGEQGERLAPQTVYVAADDLHLAVTGEGRVALSRAGPIGGFRPSADFLFSSVARSYGTSAIAVMLTGMGHDGVEGLRAIRSMKGRVLAQDEATSVVFGMPRAAIEAEVADAVLPLPMIAPRLVQMMSS